MIGLISTSHDDAVMSNRTGLRADDPYGGRQPTGHERHAGRPWDASYRDGGAPWDIGAPQRAVVRLAGAGVFGGAVLDAGCGTGDNALHIATGGLHILGIDVAETAAGASGGLRRSSCRDLTKPTAAGPAVRPVRVEGLAAGRAPVKDCACDLFGVIPHWDVTAAGERDRPRSRWQVL